MMSMCVLLVLVLGGCVEGADATSTTETIEILYELDYALDAELNPEEREDLFEGDIMLTEDQWQELQERKVISNTAKWWTGYEDGTVVIKYRLSGDPTKHFKIMNAIEHWSSNTCIAFENIESAIEEPHINFIDGVGCYSYVGMISTAYSCCTTGQPISVPSGCLSLGTVAHEIGHALGMYHEHSRFDRDDYITVLLDNINPDMINNFNKKTTIQSINYQHYDTSSALHYGAGSFRLKDTVNRDVIRSVDPLEMGLIGQRIGLSYRDIKTANIQYGCIERWQTEFPLASCGEGYVGKTGTCVCPDGTSGDNCQNIEQDYMAARIAQLAPGTETVTTEGTLTSPNYPTENQKSKMVKHIVAPACHQVVATFTDFQLKNPKVFSYGTWCKYEYLQVLFSWAPNAAETKYCGTTLASPQNVITSTTNEMILYYYDNSAAVNKGFSVDITFKPVPCITNSGNVELKVDTAGDCTFTNTSDTTYTYTSPGYPNNLKDAGKICQTVFSTSEPRHLITTVNDVKLKTKDKAKFYYVYDEVLILDDDTEVNSATAAARMDYVSKKTRGKRFKLTLEVKNNEDCHQIIDLPDGASGDITIDDQYDPDTHCEWWIRAPAEKQVQVEFSSSTYGVGAVGCSNDYLLINSAGDVTYPSSTTTQYCGSTSPGTVTSTGAQINVAVFGKTGGFAGFTATYSVV